MIREIQARTILHLERSLPQVAYGRPRSITIEQMPHVHTRDEWLSEYRRVIQKEPWRAGPPVTVKPTR